MSHTHAPVAPEYVDLRGLTCGPTLVLSHSALTEVKCFENASACFAFLITGSGMCQNPASYNKTVNVFVRASTVETGEGGEDQLWCRRGSLIHPAFFSVILFSLLFFCFVSQGTPESQRGSPIETL